MKQASVMFTGGLLGFSLIRPDGSRIFDASFTSGPGLRQFVTAMEHKVYAVDLVDPDFPPVHASGRRCGRRGSPLTTMT